MDFELDTEQEALRDAVRDLLDDVYASIDARRDATATEPGFDEATWKKLAAMGILGLPFAEEDGGMGAGPVEVAVVAEQVGAVLAPEPFVEAVVLAGGVIAGAGTAAQRARLLGGLAEGTLLPALAHLETGDPVTATRVDGKDAEDGGSGVDGEAGWVLDGVKEPVLNGARADVLVVTALVDGRLELFLVEADADGLERDGYPTYDGSRAAKVTLARTPATRLGDGTADAAAVLALATAHAQVAYCHEAVGAMATALTMTSEYLKTRKQFGVPLKTFQALTFRAADLYVSLELARSIALWATLVLADGGSTPEAVATAAARAKLQISTASRHIGQEAIQLHGGIGMTAEYAVGHYTARLTTIDHLLGDGTDHLRTLAAAVADHEVLDPLDA